MDVGILKISSEIGESFKSDKTVSLIMEGLFKKNISLSNVVFASKDINTIKNGFSYLIDCSNALLTIVDVSIFEQFKKFVCEITNSQLVLNDFAKTGIDAYFKSINQPATKLGVSNCFLPSESRCILNTVSEHCGYVFNYKDKSIFVIPNKNDEIKNMFNGSILPMISKKFCKNYFIVSLKTFSISQKEIEEVLSSVILSNKISFNVSNLGLICEIIIRYQNSSDKEVVDEIISKIYERIGKYIFTDSDEYLQDIVCDILKVQNKTISLFEDTTFGNVSQELILSKNFEDFMLEKSEIISTDKSKKYYSSNLINEEELIKDIIQNNSFENNICVVNLKSKFEQNSYLVGIGSCSDIELYKIKLAGKNSEIIEKLKQTIFYYLIKKLKQKHF